MLSLGRAARLEPARRQQPALSEHSLRALVATPKCRWHRGACLEDARPCRCCPPLPATSSPAHRAD
eukprot:4564293-Prymnesium_polylepis.1